MKDIAAVEDKETLKYVIRHELKSFGIKVPKEKRSSVRCTQAQGKEKSGCGSSIFGCPLDEVPTVLTHSTSACAVPKFLVGCVQFLMDNIDCEGLFRKPGSRSRQKELQRILENDSPIPSDAHIHDVAGLFKLFFRDLPDPLISSKLTEALIKCQQLGNSQELRYTTTLLCLTLPPLQLHTLRYALQFLKQVAASVTTNRMDASNLALVMTPNLVGGFKSEKGGSTAATEKLLRLQTAVVRYLIENADDIGAVPEAVVERVESYGNRSGDLLTDRLTSEDELDKSGDVALDDRKKNRRRRRSGPIQGLMSGIGQSLGLLKSGAGSSVVKTPAIDEVIENPSFLGETPRILRSTKRKASEDLRAFSSAKRKAMLHQMIVDPQYSKPGLSLHKDGRHGLTTPDSPITPIRPNRPALGEIDAVTEDGATVFKFQTPSIKFADESFTTFCATPSGTADVTSATPGNKKGKLNPLSSKKYKRRSGLVQADISTPRLVCASHTPKSGSVYESIKKRLGHKHTHTQPTPIQLNDMPDKSVGWRLANPPEGLGGPGILALGISPHLKRTPLMRRKQRRRKTPSSPATLFPPHTALASPGHGQESKDQRSAARVKVQGSGTGVGADSESPKVVVVDLKSNDARPDASQDDISNAFVSHECMPSNTNVRCTKELVSGDVSDKDEHYEMITDKNEDVKFMPAQTDEKSALPEGTVDLSSGEPCKQEVCTVAAVERQSLEHSFSQKSLSSVLSQVSVDSTKSIFSVEMEYENATMGDENDETVRNDDTLVTNIAPTEPEGDMEVCCGRVIASENVDHGRPSAEEFYDLEDNDDIDGVGNTKEYQAQIDGKLKLENGLTTDMPDGDDGYTGSLDSLESANTYGKFETGVSQRLVKSVSVDSGKGLSLDNLASFEEAKFEAIEKRIASVRSIKTAQDIPQGLVKMMSDRLSPVEDASEESACSISSEENPQFRETKAFWKLAKTGHIFNKSLSDSQLNSPARKDCQAQLPPVLSYHSQMHVGRKEQHGGTRKQYADTSLNPSMVKSNIDMFNSMCQRTSPVGKPRSQTARSSCHRRVQQKEQVSAHAGETKNRLGRDPLKTHLTKALSIDSGMYKLGSELVDLESNPFRKTSHDDSYKLAVFKGTTTENPGSLQESVDLCTRMLRDSKNAFQYENAEDMPVHDGDQEIDDIPDHLAPVHALHNEALTPMKLASSTIIRTPGKKSIKIRHRSPLKQLQMPSADITPPSRETRSHKRYPCSPRNPLYRRQPCLRQERSLIPNHVRNDMDIVEL